MIVCPRCSQENEDSALNCVNCRVNLQWALENLQEAAQGGLQPEERLPREAQREEPEAKGKIPPIARGVLVIVLVLAVPALGLMAFLNFFGAAITTPETRSGQLAGAWLLVVIAVAGIPAAIVVLLRRRPKPNLRGALGLLALIGLAGGLLFGLTRLTLVLVPEHTGWSLIFQYRLGERDFGGASLGGADLSGARLWGVNLNQADLHEADLSGASLYQADVRGADLSKANLSGATLQQVNLSQADLGEADLSGATLTQADLSGANLRAANLSWAYLGGVDLRGANLSGATVTDKQLGQASSLEGAILPDGSVHK